MTPGSYIVRCRGGRIQPRGNKLQVVLAFEILEKAWNDGVLLRQWYNLPRAESGLSPHCRYARACEIALEHPVGPEDDLDPEAVFVGKYFEADVGYRSNDSTGISDELNRAEKKDNRDFLRVHNLLKLVPKDEAEAAMYMRSNGVI